MRKLFLAAIVAAFTFLTLTRFVRREADVALLSPLVRERTSALASEAAQPAESRPLVLEVEEPAVRRVVLDRGLRNAFTSVSVLLLSVYLALRPETREFDLATIGDLSMGLVLAGISVAIGWFVTGRAGAGSAHSAT